MIKSESIAALTKALVVAKKEFAPILREKENPFFKSKYADLAAALEATEPALSKNGLAVSQFNVNDNDRVGVLTLLMHESGEYIGESFTLPFVKQDAQSGTAAITYARRSAYLSVLCVAAEDDDGNTAAGKETEKSVPKQAKASAPTKAVQVPKAEIPSEPLGKPAAQPGETDSPNPVSSGEVSGIIHMSANDALPTEEQTQSIRNRYSLLGKDLGDAGLKPSTGKPIGRKLTLYLLHRTGMSDAEKVTYGQWQKFFEECAAYKDGKDGYKALVEKINTIVEEKK